MINNRKNDHINICLSNDVDSKSKSNGFEKYDFIHNAFPEIDFDSIKLSTKFLNHNLATPFMVGAMSGGSNQYPMFNYNIASASEFKGWAMSVGSMRSYIEEKKYRETFNVRKYAPSVPIFANIGAVQLNYGFNLDHCKLIVDHLEADALVFHMNSIQEIIQPEGNRNFKNLYNKIYKVKNELNIPIGVKEVGWGISSSVASNLINIGVDFIDVAGAGGTSWSEVEKNRGLTDDNQLEIASPFASWGIPTASSLKTIHSKHPKIPLIGSGGINDGLTAAKAMCLGASLVSFSKRLLKGAISNPEDLIKNMEIIEKQMKIVLFATGHENIDSFTSNNPLILTKNYEKYI